jgi:RNA polymerase sigma factor (sigma-70 family)
MAPLWQISDARLVARVRKGDQQAFEQLYARYQPSVLSFARHLTGQREDAEDAVQHAFLAAYQRIAESEDSLDVRPWLFAVARNRCLSLLRARGTQGVTASVAGSISMDGLAAEVERRQELRDLVGDLARLPEPQRAALLLSQIEALSHGEIASALGVAPEKVKALVFQARSSLAATREARDAPCSDIRTELATSRGAALRRRTLRRHVHECSGCREFEIAVQRQRHELDVLLPVLPTLGLHRAVLEAVTSREGAAAGSAAGVAAASGGAGSGIVGSLLGIGAEGAAKLALVGVIAGGTTAGAVAADLPARIEHSVDRQAAGGQVLSETPGDDGDSSAPWVSGRSRTAPVGQPKSRADAPSRRIGGDLPGHGDRPPTDVDSDPPAEAPPGAEQGGGPEGSGGAGDLPPGLARRDELPPGLAKKDELPPGLAKRGGSPDKPKGTGTPPGQVKKQDPAAGGNGNGNGGGDGQSNAGGNGQGGGGNQGNANGGGGNGNGGGGNGNGGGQGNGGGSDNAGGNGQANGGGKKS